MKNLFPLAVLLFLMASVNFGQAMPEIEPGVSRELARWRAANYSDVRYKLNLNLEKMSPVLKGTIQISLKNNADAIVLDWRKIRGKEEFTTVSSAQINGKPARFTEEVEHLVFREGVVKGENTISLDFTSPIATSGAAVTRYVDKEDGAEYIYSLFVPSDASTAFPLFDQPDLKAKFQLNATISRNWKIVSNTNQTNETSITKIQHPGENDNSEPIRTALSDVGFQETKPISTYVFAFAAGDFEKFDGNNGSPRVSKGGKDANQESALADARASDSKIYVRKSQAEKFKQHAAEIFRLNRECVKFLEGYFDYKFPFPKYDLVLIPEFPFGGMEHAGATFLRESSIIFPQEPTANDYISRGNLIFHEAAHQWFGDTVTMRWFDDLWLKEGFAEFMAYKTMEKVLPQYNAWKAFYERNKPLAYLTDSTKGTTPIYQEIPNLSSAKSAYGNIVYRKAPAFLKQAEFYLGADKFQTAVRAFLKQNAFKNAEWQDLVKSFEATTGQDLKNWAETWVKERGAPIFRMVRIELRQYGDLVLHKNTKVSYGIDQNNPFNENKLWIEKLKVLFSFDNIAETKDFTVSKSKEFFKEFSTLNLKNPKREEDAPNFVFPNYQDYGYGIFLLDERSRIYVLANIQNEKDDFLRSMMWGALWDSVREAELNPKDYVELAIKNIGAEKDELTIQTILSRVGTAMNYYVPEKQSVELAPRLEKVLGERMTTAETLGQRVTFYRAFLNVAATEPARQALKDILSGKLQIKDLKLKTKDKFDIAARLLILDDKDAPVLLAELEKIETSDEAKRYAYAARAGIADAANKARFFGDFVGNKEISESYIETAAAPFNSTRHADLTLPFLEKALAELPNLKRNRKIFFVNNWLQAFIGGQKSEKAVEIVNKFLADNPNLDRDLRLKILENVDGLERAVRIRKQFK